MELKPKTKLKAMGYSNVKKIDTIILNPTSINLFQDPYKGNVQKCHGAQYYSDFIDQVNSGSRAAKWKANQHLAFIQIITPQANTIVDFPLFKSAFEAFFIGITIVQLDEKLALVKKNEDYYLENKKAKISQLIRVFEDADGNYINLSSSDIIQGQRALLKYYENQEKKEKGQANYYFSSVSFINHPIIIECSPQDKITGRAQGYEGAVISLSGCSQREVLTTALHECMHIFSIDHCIWWDCMMNFSYEFSPNFSSGGSIHLCPSCLVKLHYQLDFDILARYARLYQFFKADAKYLDDAKFVQSLIKSCSKSSVRKE